MCPKMKINEVESISLSDLRSFFHRRPLFSPPLNLYVFKKNMYPSPSGTTTGPHLLVSCDHVRANLLAERPAPVRERPALSQVWAGQGGYLQLLGRARQATRRTAVADQRGAGQCLFTS